MVNKTTSESPTERLGDTVRTQAAAVRETASDFAQSAAETVDQGRTAAAERLDQTASAVRDRSESLPGGPRVREFAHAAADRLSSTADYVRDHDLNRMVGDVETMVKKNPGPALLVAAAFGFLLGRALTRE